MLETLQPRPGETLLDVGCGTGYFTRRFARDAGAIITGVDPDLHRLEFARGHAVNREAYVAGRAEILPFADRSFDCCIAVTSLCFIEGQRKALEEMARVTRRRVAVGLLNRHSILYLEKGRGGGTGGYRGARWHSGREARELFEGLPLRNLILQSAVFLPGGNALAQRIETLLPPTWLRGAFLVVTADVAA